MSILGCGSLVPRRGEWGGEKGVPGAYCMCMRVNFQKVPVRYRPNAASGGWSYGRGLVHCREN